MESELADLLPSDVAFELIDVLAESAVPSIRSFGAAVNGEQRALQSLSAERSLTLNISPHIVNTVNAVIAREIHGDVHLSENDTRILGLIAAYGKQRGAELSLFSRGTLAGAIFVTEAEGFAFFAGDGAGW